MVREGSKKYEKGTRGCTMKDQTEIGRTGVNSFFI